MTYKGNRLCPYRCRKDNRLFTDKGGRALSWVHYDGGRCRGTHQCPQSARLVGLHTSTLGVVSGFLTPDTVGVGEWRVGTIRGSCDVGCPRGRRGTTQARGSR